LERDRRTGKRRQKWISGYQSRRDAERAIPQLVRDIDARRVEQPTARHTTATYLRLWLETLPSRGLRVTTVDGYRVSIESHLIPRIGAIQLGRLTPDQINAAYFDLLVRGRRDGAGALSPRTVRLAHTVLRKALADAVRWGQLDRNAAVDADPPRRQRAPEMQVWTAEELRLFLGFVDSHPLSVYFRLLSTTGMRRGEGLGLRWRHVDFENRQLAVVQSLVRTSGGAVLSTPKTQRSRRAIALDVRTLEALMNHRDQQRASTESGLVFGRHDGSPLAPHSVSKTFVQLVKNAELPRIRLHDLRHTYATLALRAGVHPKVVSERLGHSSIALTLDTYSHVLPVLDSEAAERVAELLQPATQAEGPG
jgi:integrase